MLSNESRNWKTVKRPVNWSVTRRCLTATFTFPDCSIRAKEGSRCVRLPLLYTNRNALFLLVPLKWCLKKNILLPSILPSWSFWRVVIFLLVSFGCGCWMIVAERSFTLILSCLWLQVLQRPMLIGRREFASAGIDTGLNVVADGCLFTGQQNAQSSTVLLLSYTSRIFVTAVWIDSSEPV